MSDDRWLENLERAHRELTSFVALPITNARDRAGIVQAFEFTFELSWKAMQRLASRQSLNAGTPRAALQAGLAMGIIAHDKEAVWAQMLRDRNLSSHTYNEQLANTSSV